MTITPHPATNPLACVLDWRAPLNVSIKSICWMEGPWERAETLEVEIQSGGYRGKVSITSTMAPQAIREALTAGARRLQNRFFPSGLDLERGRAEDTRPIRLRA